VNALLDVRGVSKSFRGLKAVQNASFTIPEGSINALIGPNGAGKTTIFNMVAGVFPPDSGSIVFQGKPINGFRPDQVCAAGIGRTFQIVKPFAGLTVLDNVVVGDRSTLAACGVADKDVPPGLVVSGNPARNHREELRERALVRRLPKLLEQIKELAARVESLETSANHRP